MIEIFSFIVLLYCILILLLFYGWNKANQHNSLKTEEKHFISVVVPVRNEEERITNLLRHLRDQNYHGFEVIVVNDHSDDDTFQKIRQEIADDNRFLCLQNSGIGKKHALTTGIKAAKGAIIVATDADCSMGASWLKTINSYFTEHVSIAFGAVTFSEKKGTLAGLQRLEFSAVIGMGVTSWSLGYPTMCNGANLAFRKAVFIDVNGYEDNFHIPSGDDEFLMRKIIAKYPHSMQYLNSTDAIVTTNPVNTFAAFVHQRVRWAAKWKYNSSWYSKALALFVVAVQLATLILISSLLFNYRGLIVFILSAKVVVDFLFLSRVAKTLLIRWNFVSFLLLQVVYPFYVLSIGVSSNFLSYTWKGRKS